MRSLKRALSTFLFTVTAVAAQPIFEVYNAASFIPAAVQNIAQGSRFVFRFTGTESDQLGGHRPIFHFLPRLDWPD